MVALVLVVMLFSLIPEGTMGGSRSKLENTLQEFQSAIRFSVNESILRNTVVRINIDLTKEPNEWAIEYGPSAEIPLPEVPDTSRMSLQEQEDQAKKDKAFDAKFNRVNEFADDVKKLPDGVRVLGVASSYLNAIRLEGSVSIYFYPSGGKDGALIFFTTDEEMAHIEIPPFEDKIDVSFSPYSQSDLDNLEDSQDNKMKEIFEKWLKE